MVVALPSGHKAALEPADLQRLLACGGNTCALVQAVWAHPDLGPDILNAAPDDRLAVAAWAIAEFVATDEAAELAAVCERFGEAPSSRLGVGNRTLAFRLDQGCLIRLDKLREAHGDGQKFNAGDVNGG